MEDQEEVAADTTSTFDMGDYSFLLRRTQIDSMQLVVDDRTREFYTRIDNFGAKLSLSLSSSVSKMDVKTGFGNAIVWRKGDLLVKKTSMDLETRMLIDQDSMKLSFKKANLRVNGIDFKSSGKLRRDTVSQNILVDVTSSLSTPSLAEFLTLIPSSMIDGKEKITTQGEVAFDVKVEGEWGEDVMPTVSTTIKIDKAKARYASRKIALENVSCDGFAFVDFNTPALSYVDIKRLNINTSDIIDLDVTGKVKNFMGSPEIDLAVVSQIDFDRFTEVFPLNEGIICSGSNTSNIKAQFSLSDVMDGNYARLNIDGESTFKDLEMSFDASKFVQDSSSTAYLYIKANQGKMLFGDKAEADTTNSRTLRSKINFSGINYQAKSGEYMSINDIEVSAGANFDRATSAVNGMGIKGLAKNASVGIDSLFAATLESSDIRLMIAPKNDKRETIIKATIASDQIKAEEPTFNSTMSLTSVNMSLNMQRIAERDWDTAGTVSFSDFGMYSDIFPLDIAIPKSTVTLDNKIIYLKNASMSVGESKFKATGHITNIIQKFFIDPDVSISGELAINAKLLNISELMEASNESFALFEEEEETTEVAATESTSTILIAEVQAAQVAEVVAEPAPEPTPEPIAEPLIAVAEPTTEPATEPAVRSERRAPADTISTDSLPRRRMRTDSLGRQMPPPAAGALFLVPRGVDFVFDLNVEKALFEDAEIEDMAGRAIIKKGALALEKLTLKAIGAEASGALTYSNRGRAGANVAFIMSLSEVDINRIGELVPSINTMFPMLQSFEGMVNFEIKANTNLTRDAELDINSLKSSMFFKGRDLVLMDSETFADLSKTLMFKNKDRNLIDSLEAYALVEGSKVDLLPFSMSMDRYTAIIGGTQNIDPTTFDVDYQYNISIIKSPLPFKAGVDINGDLVDFSFKITTAKLKNADFDEQRAIYEQYRDSIK
ncbi:MAG: hypothetical protein SNH94_02565 [Rikenellaceae bacterium]